MTSSTKPEHSMPGRAIDQELAALEQRLALLLTHAKALGAANEALRRGLTAAETHNQTLSERVAEAKRRLDALIARLPERAQ
jgi:cell division protein FtsB